MGAVGLGAGQGGEAVLAGKPVEVGSSQTESAAKRIRPAGFERPLLMVVTFDRTEAPLRRREGHHWTIVIPVLWLIV